MLPQVLIGGSRIVLTRRGTLRLAQSGLHLGDAALALSGVRVALDLHVAGERVVALFDRRDAQTDIRLASTMLALDAVEYDHRLPHLASRVVTTARRVFVGSTREVVAHTGRRIHEYPLDLAATEAELAILDADGVTFYDAVGTRTGEVPLFAPAAIAVDRIEGGWLAAIDGGVVHLVGPDSTPRMIAPVAERVRKVRRTREAVYILVRNEVHAIRGDHVELLGPLDHGTSQWNDFDAGPEGIARFAEAEPVGPQRWSVSTRDG